MNYHNDIKLFHGIGDYLQQQGVLTKIPWLERHQKNLNESQKLRGHCSTPLPHNCLPESWSYLSSHSNQQTYAQNDQIWVAKRI